MAKPEWGDGGAFERIEHLALRTDLALADVCERISAALDSSAFDFDSENETEWGVASVRDLAINVSRPHSDGALHRWDPSVPIGCNVAVAIGVPRSQQIADYVTRLIPEFARAIAAALHTTVVHHRTWTGPGKNQHHADEYRAD